MANEKEELTKTIELFSGLLGELTMRTTALESILLAKGLISEQELAESLTACMLKLHAVFERAALTGEPDSISSDETEQ